jgi:hypothetical protein
VESQGIHSLLWIQLHLNKSHSFPTTTLKHTYHHHTLSWPQGYKIFADLRKKRIQIEIGVLVFFSQGLVVLVLISRAWVYSALLISFTFPIFYIHTP